MKRQRHNQGFTLIELLLVIVILGILIVIGLTSFISSQKKSRDLKRKQDLRQVAVSLEAYYNDKGKYPVGDGNTGVMIGCFVNDGQVCDWGGSFEDKNGTTYMVTLPTESSPPARYFYVSASGAQYQLYTRLENPLDSEIPKDASNKARVFSDLTCSTTAGVYCNYGVSSTNVAVSTGRTVTYE